MKEIPLTKGKIAIVDDDDYGELIKYKWCLSGSGYAIRQSPRNHYARHLIHMHREINKTPVNMFTDHINHNRLDNRKENLRTVTTSQNHMNKSPQTNNTSGFRGSFWHKKSKKWRSQIRIDKKYIHIAYFDTAREAAQAYESVAQQLFGDFYSE